MHTKGPWTIYRKTSVEIEAGPHRSYVAYCGTEANARLIESAPEQNTALIDLVALVRRIVPDADMLHEVHNADEAIRKAKGQ